MNIPVLGKTGMAEPCKAKKGFKMAAIFTAVDLTTVAAFVSATGVLVVGIALAFKGIGLAKRGIRGA